MNMNNLLHVQPLLQYSELESITCIDRKLNIALYNHPIEIDRTKRGLFVKFS